MSHFSKLAVPVKIGQVYQTPSGPMTVIGPGTHADMWRTKGSTGESNIPYYVNNGDWKLLHSPGDKPMSPRQILAEKVITGLQEYAYVFGGYLRDKLAGEEFTDVDLFFPTGDTAHTALPSFRIVGKLRSLGLDVRKIRGGKPVYAANGTSVRRNTFEVLDPTTGASIQVDAVTNGSADHPFSDLDADVNSLYLDRSSGQIKPHWITPYTMEDIQTHIREKTFEVPDTARIAGHRLNKLINKGYVPLNMKYNREEILKNYNQDKSKSVEVHGTIGDLIREKLGQKAENNTQNLAMETYKVKYEVPNTAAQSARKEEKKMTGFEKFQSELKEAGWRAGTAEMAEGVKQGILLMIKDEGGDDGMVALATKFLETQAGTALISELLGHGLPMAPFGIGADPRAVKAAEEFRTDGYKIMMQVMFRLLMKYMLPAIQSGLAKLPPVTEADMAELDAASKAKVRVESNILTPDTTTQMQAEAQAQAELEQLRAEVAALKRHAA